MPQRISKIVVWSLAPILLALLGMAAGAAAAQPSPPERIDAEEFEAKLQYQQGKIELKGGLATLNLGPKFRYLDPAQTDRVLQAWGNPPDSQTLGMILPAGQPALGEETWAVILQYEEDGYVSDEGAEEIDYAKLLKEMKEGVASDNKERAKEGYEAIELIGWAEPPHYDKTAHKLYWAKDLKFGSEDHTLNYNIRVLGRRGVLVLNAVSSLEQLPEIRSGVQALLPAVEFNEGHRYADFIPGKDKVAEYGIAALVAGSIAAKTGLFKALLAGILAFKKLILVGLVAAGAFFRKMFGKKDSDPGSTAPLGP